MKLIILRIAMRTCTHPIDRMDVHEQYMCCSCTEMLV